MDHQCVDGYLERLWLAKKLTILEIRKLLIKARELLIDESNVVRLSTPISICGDVHGQFFDVKELFAIGGRCPETSYLFLGDYVDRGRESIEVFLLLIALKVRHPDRITLLRGNHECRQTSQNYGFYDDCVSKYGTAEVWRQVCDVFDLLPLSAVIDDTIFCVHGGLSPNLATLDEIRALDRQQELPNDGPITDLLWSDPDDGIDEWVLNARGAGFQFGSQPLLRFHHTNRLMLTARAHQLAQEGFWHRFENRLVTVWSAPNYMYRCNNLASILEVSETLKQDFKIFGPAPADSGSAAVNRARPLPDYFL